MSTEELQEHFARMTAAAVVKDGLGKDGQPKPYKRGPYKKKQFRMQRLDAVAWDLE